MAGNETTPGVVDGERIFDSRHSLLLGPLASAITMPKNTPLIRDGIKAVWRNEIGDAR